jgi:hypothetical protein
MQVADRRSNLFATVTGAATAGLIVPILIGPPLRIQTVRMAAGADITTVRLIDAPDGPRHTRSRLPAPSRSRC